MPEVVDSCSLASPESVCRTKHLHLRCRVDFTRRALTGTAALTVQSQEDNLHRLVRWDAHPVPASPRPPASRPLTPLRPLPGPAPPAAPRFPGAPSRFSAPSPSAPPPSIAPLPVPTFVFASLPSPLTYAQVSPPSSPRAHPGATSARRSSPSAQISFQHESPHPHNPSSQGESSLWPPSVLGLEPGTPCSGPRVLPVPGAPFSVRTLICMSASRPPWPDPTPPSQSPLFQPLGLQGTSLGLAASRSQTPEDSQRHTPLFALLCYLQSVSADSQSIPFSPGPWGPSYL